MRFEHCEYCINEYSKGYNKIVTRTFNNNKYWQGLEAHRQSKLTTYLNKNEKNILYLKKKIKNTVDFGLLKNCNHIFQSFNKMNVPLLNTMPILNYNIEQSSKSKALNILKKQKSFDSIQQILNHHTSLTNKDLNFRSEEYNHKLTIYGNNKPFLKSLTSLCHEVGHLLIEFNAINTLPKFKHSLIGEVFAHNLEYIAGMTALNHDKEKQFQWQKWCFLVDFLNILFFYIETDESGKFKDIFFKNSLILRQSYYCTPGYQYINGYSSYFRLKKFELLKIGDHLNI